MPSLRAAVARCFLGGLPGPTLDPETRRLHAEIPFPVNLFTSARDAHLWFTHTPPPALVRAEQNLAAKDDPVVVIDVTPRGAAHAPRKMARHGEEEGAR